MQRPTDGLVNSATPPSMRSLTPHGMSARASLPDRNVVAASIEDAYVAFILYCNPAVPLDADSSALRESFRTPPKSGGKSFSTFTLFELIRKLETKEIKTWAELALKLGVEPPDQDKGQSSQKIQQYAVRLKRWMHSMHVDAFFEYLLGNHHPYWTQIPADTNLAGDTLRDGVAAEDDMALRALLPQIRPKRGRRRPEDDESGRPSPQRPRLESPPAGTPFPGTRGHDGLSPWSVQPDGRLASWLPSATGQPPPAWPADTTSHMALPAYPQSAITPSTRNAFWSDEPKSAITPSKGRTGTRRHGAKVVSSAWRSGASGGTGKTRGRPPINRGGAEEGPYSAYPTTDGPPHFALPSPNHTAGNNTQIPVPSNFPIDPSPPPPPSFPPVGPPSIPNYPDSAPNTAGPKASRPNRLSLQVPERVGGEVRLATPPPAVMVNGQSSMHMNNDCMDLNQPRGNSFDLASIDILNGRNPNAAGGSDKPPPNRPVPQGRVRLEDPNDRTNMAELEAFFIHTILSANWQDARGNPIRPCGVDEASAIASSVIDDLLRSASTKETFLINLAALAGSKILMTTSTLRVVLLEECADHNKYICNWELRFGDVRGEFSMKEQVSHRKWKGRSAPDRIGGDDDAAGENTAARWQRKYREVLDLVKKKDDSLSSLKSHVLDGLMDRTGPPAYAAATATAAAAAAAAAGTSSNSSGGGGGARPPGGR
ncbi:uncharacterized protein E0L32_008466 [Thyridium curvatum]|uniref:Ars binding protein 2 n=1 Tax=Thyridium curvatum TaxID=1093900 RepID=A0A507B202_9PEZI|nr:uncharacterized protein E0L32_008466 [Thyridium curvatum]TPX10580.1 hypothetical protein E0L32_008466 [Thyridium curvatum]